jgi:hypothetical protein
VELSPEIGVVPESDGHRLLGRSARPGRWLLVPGLVGSRFRSAVPAVCCACEKARVQQRVQELLTRPRIQSPQAARLSAGQPEARHFEVFPPNAPD